MCRAENQFGSAELTTVLLVKGKRPSSTPSLASARGQPQEQTDRLTEPDGRIVQLIRREDVCFARSRIYSQEHLLSPRTAIIEVVVLYHENR